MRGRSLRLWRAKVAWAALEMWRRGLVCGSAGNVSLRVGEMILITPTHVPYNCLRPGQIIVIDFSGQVLSGAGKPSSEWRLHVAIYQARKDVGAVVHTHSPYAVALASSYSALPVLHDEGKLLFGEEVPKALPAPPGTWELAQEAVAALGSGGAVLVARHGVVTVGPTLAAALALAEKLEETAKIYILSQLTATH